MQGSVISTEGHGTHAQTHIREELRFLSWLIYLSAVHQLSGPGDDIMCDISPWPLLPQCSFPAQTQPSSLPAQQHPNLSWPSSTISPSSKVFLREAGPGCRDGHMCRPSGHVQALAVSGCCLSHWHLMAAQNILALLKEPDKITEKQQRCSYCFVLCFYH